MVTNTHNKLDRYGATPVSSPSSSPPSSHVLLLLEAIFTKVVREVVHAVGSREYVVKVDEDVVGVNAMNSHPHQHTWPRR
jgi:hypothetical protein